VLSRTNQSPFIPPREHRCHIVIAQRYCRIPASLAESAKPSKQAV
jgi:hypothetical protein